MRSFTRKADNRRQVYLALVGSIEGQLRDAYSNKHDKSGLSQSDVARKLNVDRSVINHRLNGKRNMTIETIADMVWALEHCIKVSIFDPESELSNEKRIVPQIDAPQNVLSMPMANVSSSAVASAGSFVRVGEEVSR